MRMFPVAAIFTILCALTSAASAQTATVQVSHGIFHKRVCSPTPGPLRMSCHSHVVTDSQGHVVSVDRLPLASLNSTSHITKTVSGYSPAQLQSAYGVTWNGTTKPSKTTPIIAIVDAYGYANAQRDLTAYRKQFKLPPCTAANGCFKKVNQTGGTKLPKQDVGWSQETALDLQMVSAICPYCRILLVESNTNSFADMAAAVNTAATKKILGGQLPHAISNSYGGGETYGSPYGGSYNQPGIAITASTGDDGWGPQFPATANTVIAVGGTSLYTAATSRGWTETAWSGAGSGCSSVYDAPVWQSTNPCATLASGKKGRVEADTSAVADPATGVAVYAPMTTKKSAWAVFGGTSAASPLIAGIYGVNLVASHGTDVQNYYGAQLYAAAGTSEINDVTSGSNGSCGAPLCTSGVGYDGPTGIGTPAGSLAY